MTHKGVYHMLKVKRAVGFLISTASQIWWAPSLLSTLHGWALMKVPRCRHWHCTLVVPQGESFVHGFRIHVWCVPEFGLEKERWAIIIDTGLQSTMRITASQVCFYLFIYSRISANIKWINLMPCLSDHPATLQTHMSKTKTSAKISVVTPESLLRLVISLKSAL